MRISDWSSDVCSSDLAALAGAAGSVLEADPRRPPDRLAAAAVADLVGAVDRRRGRAAVVDAGGVLAGRVADAFGRLRDQRLRRPLARPAGRAHEDRKSTRLNSSH